MKREELLKSREYWINQIQNDLYGIIEEYMKEKKMNRSELAKELDVTKGYITQVLKGDFDHKISKMVDLALSSGQVPLLYFTKLDKFIKNDSEGKYYEIFPVIRPENLQFKSDTNSYYHSYADILNETSIKGHTSFAESNNNN